LGQNLILMHKLLIFVFLLLFTLTAHGQFSVGYKYGIGSHGVTLEPQALQEFQVPFILSSHGVVIAYNNVNNAGLQLEINLAQKGWKEEIDTIAGTFFKRNLDYIEIPIFAHFEIGNRMLRPTINAGPYIGWKINDTWDSNGFEDQLANEAYNHYLQKIRTVDLGIKVAVGLRLNINKHFAIFSEVRYDFEIAGGSDIFIDRVGGISISRLTETSGVFGILWHIIPQKILEEKKGYKPKEDLYEVEY